MSGNDTRKKRPFWVALPALCGLWCLLILANALVALGKDGLALKKWTLGRLADLRGL